MKNFNIQSIFIFEGKKLNEKLWDQILFKNPPDVCVTFDFV